jgi:hypothetical protein
VDLVGDRLDQLVKEGASGSRIGFIEQPGEGEL